MKKANKIIYWVATVWLALGLTSTGIVQVLRVKSETDFIINLGYPEYFLTILGVSKILAAIAVLIPRFPLVKEWAYAGIVFTMTGAIYSHIASGNSMNDIFPPLLLLVLSVVSWYFRPESRRVKPVKTNAVNA